MRRIALSTRIALAVLALGSGAPALSAPVLVDWTSGNAGTLPGVSVGLSGTNFHAQAPGDSTYLNNLYNRPGLFTGPVSLLEGLEIAANPAGITYTVTFSAPVSGVVLHFASLASTLTFDRNVSKLSGETGFDVLGQIVSGLPQGTLDRSGSVLVGDVGTSFSFTAQWAGGSDGIGMQMYAGHVMAVPEPASLALLAGGLLALAAGSRRQGRR